MLFRNWKAALGTSLVLGVVSLFAVPSGIGLCLAAYFYAESLKLFGIAHA